MKDLLKVFLVDDEPLALKRLSRLLLESGKVEITGQTTEPLKALQIIPNLKLDAIFLDIQMPELTGFELLQKLKNYPPVIFTTAFDEFALKAFEVFSVDYLLKPIEFERLEVALEKLERISQKKSDEININLQQLLQHLSPQTILERIPSRIGGKVQILDVQTITHFFAKDKMIFAQNLEGKRFPVDFSLNELEKRLEKRVFLRVHRNSIVNITLIEEVHGWFSGQVAIRLKNLKKTEIIVARDRVKTLKEFLAM
jgi:two-component system, LytTR family, response regulator